LERGRREQKIDWEEEYKYVYPSTDKYRMNIGKEDRSEDCPGILDEI